MQHEFFVPVCGGSIAARNGGHFKSSLAAHPKELEVPDSMLALAATSVCRQFIWWYLCGHSLLVDRYTQLLTTTPMESSGRQTLMPTCMKTFTVGTCNFLPTFGKEVPQSTIVWWQVSMRKLRKFFCSLFLKSISCAALRNVSAPGVTSVSNDAILQLDLAGMEE